MKRFHAIILTATVLLTGCGGTTPEKVSYNDPRLRPLWRAVEAVDRRSLGFTPISKDADIRLERSHGAYDAMLHVYGATSRTIAFREVGGDYRWLGEQELHVGPKKHKTVDGVSDEEIVITYEVENVSGVPLNQVVVQYHGDDPRFADPRQLTLDDVRPILEEWAMHRRKASQGI